MAHISEDECKKLPDQWVEQLESIFSEDPLPFISLSPLHREKEANTCRQAGQITITIDQH